MIGLKWIEYGLDLGRIVAGDANYSIFYSLLCLPNDQKTSLHLHENFHYLKDESATGTLARKASLKSAFASMGRSKSLKRDTRDATQLSLLQNNLKSLGIGQRVQLEMFKVLAAILHLGNLVFINGDNNESATVKNIETLSIVADLLHLQPSDLENAMVYRHKWINRQLCSFMLKCDEAARHRDELVKTLYSGLFSWLVERLNSRLCKPDEEADLLIVLADFSWYRTETGPLGADYSTLLFNYAQERLLEFRHSVLFHNPRALLEAEGIRFDMPVLQDNARVLDLFHGSGPQKGLFTLLDEGVQGLRSSSFTFDLLDSLDMDLKRNEQYIPSSKCTTRVSMIGSRLDATFGVRHYQHGPSVEYNLEQFVSQSAILSDFVPLFRDVTGSERSFVANLFSKKMGIKEEQRGRFGASKPLHPLRKPSIKRKAKQLQPDIALEEFASSKKSIDDMIAILESTRNWFVFCSGNPSDRLSLDPSSVQGQMQLCSLQELRVSLQNLNVDFDRPLLYKAFLDKYSFLMASKGFSIVNGSAQDLVRHFVLTLKFSTEQMAFGNSQILLSLALWRHLDVSLKQLLVPSTQSNFEYPDDETESNVSFDHDSDDYPSDDVVPDIESQSQKVDPKMAPNEHVEAVRKVTPARCCWVVTTWSLTCWIPSFCLGACGMKRQDIRMAWREKVALCMIIALLCLTLLFFIIGLGWLLCPPSKIRTPDEVLTMSKGQSIPYMSLSGRYILPQDVVDRHIGTFGDAMYYQIPQFYGTDVSKLFFKQDLWGQYCPSLLKPSSSWDYLDESVPWMKRPPSNESFLHRTTNSQGLPQDYAGYLLQYALGPIGYSKASVKDMTLTGRVYIIIYQNVYFVNGVLNAPLTFPKEIRDMFNINAGQDLTLQWEQFRSTNLTVASNVLTCMNNLMYVGTVDNRDSLQCQFSNYMLLSASVVLVLVIGVKFLSALQFRTSKIPEQLEKFVICMIPCYTEGFDSLHRTLQALAVTDYDDKRKLLFIVCDGMIIGAGNDRPTPQIVLEILGVESLEAEAFAFRSLGEGNRQFNIGRVYSGLYNVKGHKVPYIVVAKTGSPKERAKPGNRGKRDSQLILMNFFSRVHYNAEMNPLELEMVHHLKNVIGIEPSFYEYVLMVDADTKVEPECIRSMISMMAHNGNIMGLCGETKISNEKDSWVTMIQVYEYFISHHMAKAFESLFGTVTCLPGCFSMYRLRTVQNNPLLISKDLLNDYGVNVVDTLHQKNLLHLGEDRYLTTLMLKHFPQMQTKFTPEAECSTIAPDRYQVLLSQRRRWINSTVHNLFELVFLERLCGFCCFGMRFVVMLDLFATLVQPATILYLVYLVYASTTSLVLTSFPLISIILLCSVYGFQVLIFLLKREWSNVVWMILYLVAIPLFSFWVPVYSFSKMDDFSWGNTRVVVGEGKRTVYVAEIEPFNPQSIPMKKWKESDGWERRLSVKPPVDKRFSSQTYMSYQTPLDAMSNASLNTKRQPFISGYSIPTHAAIPETPLPGDSLDSHPSSRSSSSGGIQQSPEYERSNRIFVPGPFPSVSSPDEISDDLIATEIRRIIASTDLNELTKKKIRDRLSERFGVDLKSKRAMINQLVDDILS